MYRLNLRRIVGCLAILGMQTCALLAEEMPRLNDGISVQANDWPWWRGPNRNGEADSNQTPPMQWSDDQNILWKAPIVGRGYGSPIIVGDIVVLQTADESIDSQSVICLDRNSGKQLWSTTVHKDGGMRKNKKSTAASNTPAFDGERIFVNFANSGAVFTTALDLSGKQLWQHEISKYVIHQGYGSSPAIYQSLVIVGADNKGGGAVAALDRKSGSIVWRRDRPSKPNYPSPILLNSFGHDQVVMIGCDQVVSLDPLTGKTLWELDGATTECVTSTVTDGTRIFTTGGYPKNHISAIRADGSGKVEWENQDRVYVPSLLQRDGYLYGILDAGIAACWKSDTGKEIWKHRLGGTFSSSPVMVGDKIFATNEGGETFIFRVGHHEFEELGKNQLGDEVLATPVIVGNRIYYRASQAIDGAQQNFLFCIGVSN
ncbi:MAG: PQQ-binding-like beta-propeller repeat protein [Pirellulaceae bacterium]|nr:PQQ-binding-like beta-propeller repeat protein [Pirellulaceae bacterium]